MSERWEYKILSPSIKGMGVFGTSVEKYIAHYEHELNELGRIGWNCYHVKTDTHPPVFYLKRKI